VVVGNATHIRHTLLSIISFGCEKNAFTAPQGDDFFIMVSATYPTTITSKVVIIGFYVVAPVRSS
jgi:hypothetical protein